MENVGRHGFLEIMRDQLALFQEGRGVPRGEYSFVTLMAGIVTMIGRSVHSLISLMLVLAPIAEISLHVLRFTLETLVRLKETKDINSFIKKALLFVAQLTIALILVFFAFNSILYPIFCIGINVGLRFLSIMAGKGLI